VKCSVFTSLHTPYIVDEKLCVTNDKAYYYIAVEPSSLLSGMAVETFTAHCWNE
jgi:hypothetical protein